MANTDDVLRKFTRELPVTLNDHELQIYGKQLAEKVQEEALLEDKKKNWNRNANADIQKVRNEITRIATARAKGEELRPVDCVERFRNGTIEILRIDRSPSEVVEVRPADMRDLQPDLPGVDEDDSHVEPAGEVNPEPAATGELRTSETTGDQTYVGDPDDRDEETEGAFGHLEEGEEGVSRKAKIAASAKKASKKKPKKK